MLGGYAEGKMARDGIQSFSLFPLSDSEIC